MGQFENILGNVYGYLKVTGISDKSDKYDNIYWDCACECGNECTIRGSSLKNSHTTSCGCLKLAGSDAGKVFGELTVIGKTEGIDRSSIFLDCLCSCGNQLSVRRDLLNREKKTFCGDKSKHKQLVSRLIDEAGKVYGKLTVLQVHTAKKISGGLLWDCICECGQATTVRGSLLRNNETTSCGCDRTVPYVDENGKKYGKWTVNILSDKKGKNGEIYWCCICDCGNERDVLAVSLRNGYSKSCGCDKNNSGNKALRNEIGARYGRLLVLERGYTDRPGKVYWKCCCDCGKETVVRADKLRSGHVQSCGCLKVADDITGKTFGKLTVIGVDGKRDGESYWLCVCGCGKETSKRGTDLRYGYVLACSKGCLAEDMFLETGINAIIEQYKGMARRKQREFALSREMLQAIIFQNCYYCELPPSNELKTNRTKKLKFKYSGIDRIDSSKGYTDDNVRPCCRQCNVSKSDLSEDEFYHHIQSTAAVYLKRQETKRL